MRTDQELIICIAVIGKSKTKNLTTDARINRVIARDLVIG